MNIKICLIVFLSALGILIIVATVGNKPLREWRIHHVKKTIYFKQCIGRTS